jgi:DNA polymerase III sliding clamp (beta) subunit (PCNA family)|tara:strand:+ start:6143 stop:7138 length:996 start_codon:yes stop_codon:yes gene_type:complete
MKREEVLNILKAVKPALANKEIIEHTTSFIFQNNSVFTYNDEVMISHPINIPIKGAVPAKELYSLLSNLQTNKIKIKQTENEVSIEGDNFKAGISLSSEASLPVKDIKMTDEWTKLPKGFCEGVGFCLFSAGLDYSNPVLTHIHVDNKFIESCDNFRLTRYKVKDSKTSMLVPVSAAKELIKYSPTHYQKTKGWVHCKNKEGVIFSFRTHTSKYPDTSAILEMKKPVDIKFPSTLLSSLVNAETVCKEELSGDKFVKVKLKGKEMRVKGKGDVGWYKESFELKKTYKEGAEFEISSKSFRDILTRLKKASLSKTKMKFEGDNFTHVVILKG